MTWLSVKEHELPMDTEILVKWKDKYGEGKAYVEVTENERVDGELYRWVNVIGVSGYDWETDFEHKDITHFQVIEG